MKALSFRYAVPGDAAIVAANLRAEDRAECLAMGTLDIAGELAAAIATPGTETLAVLHEDRPIGLFGIQPETAASDRAGVWFLGTDELNQYGREIVEVTRRYFALKLMCYSVLYNYVDSRYLASVKYLKLCGAKFIPEKARMMNKVLFHYFEVR